MKKKLIAVKLLLTLMALIACGGNPPPAPPPTPPPDAVSLHVEGARFKTAAGIDVRLLGTVIGCHTEGNDGWPLICTESLDAIKAAGLNWTHIRTGPFTAEGESPEFAFYEKGAGGKYDLTKFYAPFFGRLRTRVKEALDRGIYVEIDLPADRWVRQHGDGDLPQVDPWSAANNLQGEEHGTLNIFQRSPDEVHQTAIRKVVKETCEFANVVYTSGNEGDKSWSEVWEGGLRAAVRAEGCMRPIGSVRGGDYIVRHTSMAAYPDQSRAPVLVNEFEGEISTVAVVNQAQIADARGTYYMYWRGDDSNDEWLDVMRQLGQIRAKQPPVPCPTAAQIPAVALINTDPHGDGWDSTPLVEGADYCNAIGFPGRLRCPVRPEDDPTRLACEYAKMGTAGQFGGISYELVNPTGDLRIAWVSDDPGGGPGGFGVTFAGHGQARLRCRIPASPRVDCSWNRQPITITQ